MRVWWLPVTAALSVLPLLLAGYIRDPVYPAGYLPAPTSSTPSYPARYLASKTGYKASKTGYKTARTGYEATSTTRRPSRSTTTRRLTYERIYWEGDHWRPSSGGDSQWRPSERRPSERRPSSSGDRSRRGGQLSYTGHPAAVDRAGAVAQDRSDTYHTGNGDVCGDFQTIGLGASAASLLAFLVYILLTNSLTSTVSTTRSFTSTLSNNRSNADGDSAPSWTTRATVTATCAAAQMLERRSAHAEPARHAEMPSGQPTISSTQSRRVSSELGTRGSGGPLVVGPPVGAPPSVTGRQFGDDCFSEMIGALAGLAGLGALSGFSLSQSAQALLASMMTISALTSSSSTTTTTTTTTGNTTTTTRRRSLEDDGFSGEEHGVGLVRRMASLVLVPGEPSCVRHQLCRLVRRARHSGPPYDTALPLASLPLSWLVSKRTGQPFSDLCWVIPEAMSDRDCGRIQPGCS